MTYMIVTTVKKGAGHFLSDIDSFVGDSAIANLYICLESVAIKGVSSLDRRFSFEDFGPLKDPIYFPDLFLASAFYLVATLSPSCQRLNHRR